MRKRKFDRFKKRGGQFFVAPLSLASMSYAYLFKYIIIGDTGACVECDLPPLRVLSHTSLPPALLFSLPPPTTICESPSATNGPPSSPTPPLLPPLLPHLRHVTALLAARAAAAHRCSFPRCTRRSSPVHRNAHHTTPSIPPTCSATHRCRQIMPPTAVHGQTLSACPRPDDWRRVRRAHDHDRRPPD